MACGQVVYASGTLETNREIYNGHAAQEWPMHIEAGKFPNESYKITEAVIQFFTWPVCGSIAMKPQCMKCSI